MPPAAGGTVRTLAPAASHADWAPSAAASVVTTRVGAERGVEQRAVGGDPAGGVEEHPQRLAGHRGVDVAGGEAGRSASAVPAPTTMACESARRRVGVGARCRAGDPPRRAVAGGDAAVEAHGGLHHRVGTAEAALEQVGGEGAGRVVGADAELDGEAAVAELGDAPPGDLAVGIGQRHDHAGDAGFGDRDRARRGAPLVRARLEGGVEGGAAGAVAGGPQGLDLGVGATGRLGRALADDLAVAHHDGADPRVGRGAPPGGVALGEGPAHELGVCGHQLRSVSLSGSSPGGSGGGTPRRRRRRHRRSWSAPSPIRTLTVGPGF